MTIAIPVYIQVPSRLTAHPVTWCQVIALRARAFPDIDTDARLCTE